VCGQAVEFRWPTNQGVLGLCFGCYVSVSLLLVSARAEKQQTPCAHWSMQRCVCNLGAAQVHGLSSACARVLLGAVLLCQVLLCVSLMLPWTCPDVRMNHSALLLLCRRVARYVLVSPTPSALPSAGPRTAASIRMQATRLAWHQPRPTPAR
jgi:hypothetical protein